MSLPEVVVFSVRDASNEVRYLSFSGPQRQLRFGPEEGVFSDTARFAVEPVGGGLVHIRSCFENNYWARASRFETWVTASVPEKEEDMSNDMCTLFRTRMSGGNVSVRFVHAQSGMNVVMLPAENAHGYNLRLEFSAATDFSFIDFGVLSSTKLPKYVHFQAHDDRENLSVFKESENSGYLEYRWWGYMNREGGFEVVYSKHGELRIKSMSLNEFWSASTNKRLVVRPLAEFHPSTLFDATELVIFPPVNFVGPGIAIRSLVDNEYCDRADNWNNWVVIRGKTPNDTRSWLRPLYMGIPGATNGLGTLGDITIESYRHAWTSGPKFHSLYTGRYFHNKEPREVETIEKIDFRPWNERSFTNTTPIIKRAGMRFHGRIPDVDTTGKVVISDVATDTLQFWHYVSSGSGPWRSQDVKIVAPPNSSGFAHINTQVATYEIPFSYKQIDKFPFGGSETQHLHDGVYKLLIRFGFNVTYEDIQPLTSEVLNDDRYTDIRDLKLQVEIDYDIEPNASHEGIHAMNADIKPYNESHERNNGLDDSIEPNASNEGINSTDDDIKPSTSHERINVQDGDIELNASNEVNQE